MKIKGKMKAHLLIGWFVLSVVAVLCTAEEIGIPLLVSLASLIGSSCMTIVHQKLIDRYIRMID